MSVNANQGRRDDQVAASALAVAFCVAAAVGGGIGWILVALVRWAWGFLQ